MSDHPITPENMLLEFDAHKVIERTQRALDVLSDAFAVRPLSAADVLADLVDDDTLTIRFRRPHWTLEDPWLDAATMLISEHSAGRHRATVVGTLFGTVVRTPGPGRHVCKCERCGPVGIATAYRRLDNQVDHAAQHYRETTP